jgi:Lrp/AsnC family transcriptional regulator for asnA, asnC and gidA
MDMSQIDQLDSRIIRELQRDGRKPYNQIAKDLGVSETTVRTRDQRLINVSFIQIVAVGNPYKHGFGVVGSFKIQINPNRINSVIEELKQIEEIWYVARATGSDDIDTEFNARSLDELQKLVYERLNKIEGILRIQTSIITGYEKREYTWGTWLDCPESI